MSTRTRRAAAKQAAKASMVQETLSAIFNKNDTSSGTDMPDSPTKPSSYILDGIAYESYQDMVNAKRKRNEKVLEDLGFSASTKTTTPARKQNTSRRKAPSPPTEPTRKSRRLTSEPTELVALDYYVADWNRDNSVIRVDGDGEPHQQGEDEEELEEEESFWKDRLNDGSEITIANAVEFMESKWIEDNTIQQSKDFLSTELAQVAKETAAASSIEKNLQNSPTATNGSPTSVLSASALNQDSADLVQKLSADKEEWVAKVTPDRIYSVAAHPSPHKLLACAGDKNGYVGIWDVDSTTDEEQPLVHRFRLHSKSVCTLEWISPDALLSASYDGTVRKWNLQAQHWEEIFATYSDSDSYYAEELGFGMDSGRLFWHQHVSLDPRFRGSSDPCLFVATSIGTAFHVDLRSNPRQRITWNKSLSDKKINTLSLHPNGTTLASAGNDGTIQLWDIRRFGKAKTREPFATQQVGKSVNSAFFSPTGGSLLSTTQANKLDLINEAHLAKGLMKPTKSIPHNNLTGRWLSTFMARWHPTRDIFVSGSMAKPRQVEVFNEQGLKMKGISGAAMTAVASRCCFHPSHSKLTIVGGNSSGRMVVVR
eukprot:Nitzschia sp. Nitz4//scaffold65_size103378//75241//77143//NITZ4_004477-RA/size103378-augustus-gene-0.88-mRNA-1//-1//CDS//3329556273//6637//frame0